MSGEGGYFFKGSLALVIKLHSADPVPQIKNLSLSGIYHNALLSAGASVYLNVPVCVCVYACTNNMVDCGHKCT